MLRHACALTLALLCASGLGAEAPAVSLANVYRGDVDLGRYWVSEKLDGVRARWDGVALLSRRGNRFNAPGWFVEGFPTQALDGELWMGRGTFEELSGAVRRKVPDEAQWRRIRFMVFDLPGSPVPFDSRLNEMRRLLATAPAERIRLVEQFRVADEAELMAKLKDVVSAGGEGLMLRDGHSRYRPGPSDDLLKLKTHADAEAVVVGHVPGKGKYAGMLGSLLVKTPDGRRFRIGTGFSDAERRNPPPVGATVAFRHIGVTARGIPRFASFLGVRERAAPEAEPAR
ncbi:MAG: DNA ligase [Gammaproteobacteria bacterium]|nr:DNA ligase [Gammaproteobacteria bacterium]MYB38362.1 DNA ligase [Gammaproteobacteria bacterium]